MKIDKIYPKVYTNNLRINNKPSLKTEISFGINVIYPKNIKSYSGVEVALDSVKQKYSLLNDSLELENRFNQNYKKSVFYLKNNKTRAFATSFLYKSGNIFCDADMNNKSLSRLFEKVIDPTNYLLSKAYISNIKLDKKALDSIDNNISKYVTDVDGFDNLIACFANLKGYEGLLTLNLHQSTFKNVENSINATFALVKTILKIEKEKNVLPSLKLVLVKKDSEEMAVIDKIDLRTDYNELIAKVNQKVLNFK